MKQKKKDPKWIFIIIFFGIMFVIWNLSSSDTTNTTNPDTTTETTALPDNDEAFIMAQGFVSAQLKSPSTADFSSNYHCVPNTDSSFAIDLGVDSQNSFGAMLRSNWRVIIKWEGGDWEHSSNWNLKYIGIE
jgi:zona occludens toxin (predicted ATPase)